MCVSSEAVTERDYILRHFEENFSSRKGQRIALYPGMYLEDILRCFDSLYQFRHVLDWESTEVPDDTDLLILAAYRGDQEQDYVRIHEACEKRNIPIFDLFGVDQTALHRELEAQTYLTIAQWKELLSGYDVISASISWTVADYNRIQKRWVPRPRFMVLYRWMLNQGKTVVFFREEEEQVQDLEPEIPQLTANLFERTGKDRGYLKLKEAYPGKKILHVGLGMVRDGVAPRDYGFDSRIIRYFSLNGVPASKTNESFYADREALIREIDRHEVISFDIFDTLVKRTLLHPKDVFAVTEERTGAKGFADNRYEIQTACPHLGLDEIYRVLQERCGYDDETAAALKETELSVESSVILPRRAVAEVFHYAKARGKKVVLTSDMYLEPGFIEALLERCGITGYDALFLSCRYRMLKHEGLYEEVLKLAESGEKILHIGDNYYSDYLSAREFGLDAFYIPDCRTLAERNGYDAVLKLCGTTADRKMLGLSMAAGFDDPFGPDDDRLIADLVVSPLVLGYLQWACGELTGKAYDYFLFSSRDGRILTEAYDRLRKKYGRPLPPGRYFYTSRHAAFLTIMDDVDLAFNYANLSSFEGRLPEAFRQMFGIPQDRLCAWNGETAAEYYALHEPIIREAAERFRNGYRKYVRQEGLEGKNCAFMDYVSEGSSQSMLAHHITGLLDGFYVGIPEYASRYAPNIRYYFDWNMLDYGTEMKTEVYFTSQDAAVDYIGEDGTPVFAEEKRSRKTLERIARIHGLVRDCLFFYLENLYSPDDMFGREMVYELCKTVNLYNVENYYFDDMSGQEITEET